MYRPKNWEKTRHEIEGGLDRNHLGEGCEELVDAMLEALMEEGEFFDLVDEYVITMPTLSNEKSRGYVVIIPEEQ